ncbi:MAG: hypothetical protein LUE87_09785 [Lachnospiraceae bacterium]|nr:hypothetical protein [Lachnospiraceae bacterium]
MDENKQKNINVSSLITDRKKKSSSTFQFQDMRDENVIGKKLMERRISISMSQ